MVSQRQGRKERRAGAHRMHGCAEVVEKPGQGKLEGSGRAPGCGLGLKNLHPQPGLAEDDAGRQPVGAGADYASVTRHGAAPEIGGFYSSPEACKFTAAMEHWAARSSRFGRQARAPVLARTNRGA